MKTETDSNPRKDALDALYKLHLQQPGGNDDKKTEAFGELEHKLIEKAKKLGASQLDIEMTIMFSLNPKDRLLRIAVIEDDPGADDSSYLTPNEISLIKERFEIN